MFSTKYLRAVGLLVVLAGIVRAFTRVPAEMHAQTPAATNATTPASATAPTAGRDPKDIDQIWQRASAKRRRRSA